MKNRFQIELVRRGQAVRYAVFERYAYVYWHPRGEFLTEAAATAWIERLREFPKVIA